ncbi:hypothetical protein FSP39_025433 [Pinctada imbricata]|uniref:c-SKI SMAD4-binding domain-containing protein n=1 Tax=Pinctada imbricata TaxID=66713 RepID=A0AA88Y662_PINIB|nr:hypothetical protein FSP39_025433 [Pinctada imbricata]
MEIPDNGNCDFAHGASFQNETPYSENVDGIPSLTTDQTTDEKSETSVGTVTVFGVPIVCLYVENRERLCLAQISNTLLRDFSYNEIHNRRVALGITCLQCTPVQLEILRRTGAMPVSSRRCGLITKREAERLVRSFLEEVPPPKLPENFSFKVQHKCGWGCQGHFLPSRYNSSRAKCIKCTYCNSFFSPNKFIFHYHKTQNSAYKHPDAANFNSWRRHLHLVDSAQSESLQHAWEDVKAMFNGGSRKRVGTSTFKSRGDSDIEANKLSCGETFDSPMSQVSPVVDPFSRYLNTSPMIDTCSNSPSDALSVHPTFPPAPPSVAPGPYGNILRSLSMHYSPWWKSMYLPSQQFTSYSNAMALPFNIPNYSSIFKQPVDIHYNKDKATTTRNPYSADLAFSSKPHSMAADSRKAKQGTDPEKLVLFPHFGDQAFMHTQNDESPSAIQTCTLTKDNVNDGTIIAASKENHSKDTMDVMASVNKVIILTLEI